MIRWQCKNAEAQKKCLEDFSKNPEEEEQMVDAATAQKSKTEEKADDAGFCKRCTQDWPKK